MVSTHHLDEAEMLGDRILIIADGKLKCAGSPTFLKSKLGDGYQLCILKEEGNSSTCIYQFLVWSLQVFGDFQIAFATIA